MKNTLAKYAAVGLFAVAFSNPANALSIFTLPTKLKATFKMVDIDGILVEQSTVTAKETEVVDGVTKEVYKTQKEAVKDNGDGTKEVITTQIEMTVTPKADEPGTFIVETRTVTTSTPVDAGGVSGTPVVTDPPVVPQEVLLPNLNLPPVSEVDTDVPFEQVPGKTGL